MRKPPWASVTAVCSPCRLGLVATTRAAATGLPVESVGDDSDDRPVLWP